MVFIAAPNMLHLELVEAAAAAGKHVFCEKPVGGTPEQTVRAERAARQAGVTTGVGYNYRWAPLVQYARQLIADGRAGRDHELPRPVLLDVRQRPARACCRGASSSTRPATGSRPTCMSHSVDLAHMLLGPIARVVGTTETFIPSARSPARPGRHYGRGRPGDPTGAVTNEDYAGMLCEFASGARGTFEASRTIVGPESQNAFDVYGTKGALGWNLEKLNELQLYLAEDELHTGYRTVFGGDRFPYHGAFVPGSAQRHRLRGPRRHRGLRVLPRGRRGPPVHAGLRRRASTGSACRRRCCARRSRAAGRTSSRCGRSDRWTRAAGSRRRRRHAPLRIGVIGVGRIGRMHAELLARQVPGAALARSTTPRAETRADAVGAELGVPVAGRGGRAARRARRRRGRDLLVDRHPRRPDRRRGRAPARRSSARSRSRWTSTEVDRALAAVRGRRRPVPDRLQPPLRPRPPVGRARRSPTGRSATRTSCASPAATPPRRRWSTSASRAGSSST